MSDDTTAVLADGIRKTYGRTTALDGFDLAVPAGTVYGVLGPNGAGKTTAVRILTTLLRFDAGRARVAGYDVAADPDRVRAAISLTGQYAAVDEVLSGRQNLVLFGRLRRLSARRARRRAEELLDRFGLTEAADRSAGGYSGGMRRRLDLAASLVVPPRVLFLDEPTTGLDPRSRNGLWTAVRELVADGTTVLLTTQYLQEADHLADRVCVIDTGRVVAEGTPDRLKARIGADRLELVVRDAADLPAAAAVVERATAATATVDPELRRVDAPVADRIVVLTAVLRALDDAGVAVEDVLVRRPTLDEAFLRLTGGGHAGAQRVGVSS
ncbi:MULTISPECIES: ATP-binding cassette domain-containing protein [unclassified Micromonospora]|uniref:ATP-binding cassette domain-containing protein n=1 Tax=unclassified Micromonospora TaxID=2617518 RepID=UPI001C216564|nr:MULTISPECIES: ATP-binding cassette domain-containing protein [unclassified Micromonospora]MBU8860884.1 ATP-binding cassette domain-containing protein [Micromonospora sp. WMMB482]MDM4777854.1 ATP-binding cassette domain-containing protein [Micromonospora sp. b486]MDM4780426.1 ATP-binding cassette domain-containing protein [Micromonospora sp. b486]